MSAIEIREVSKSFGSVMAVAGLSLDVPEGSIYGFIGPNGSGKSTTMRMIVGISHPDGGSIRVFGEEMSARAPDGRTGYLPEERGLYRKMTVRALLEFHAALSGARNPGASVDRWLSRMNLSEWGPRRIEALSKGMTQKVQFIAAVVAEPRLIVLDEPFSGLDPVSAESMREAILELRANGTTVVLSTHDMNTAESFCDSIFMIFQGRKVLDGSLESIQDAYGADTIRVRAEGGAKLMDALPGVEAVRDFGRVQELRLRRGADPQVALRELLTRTAVAEFSVTRPSLEDIFVRIAKPAEIEETAYA